MKNQKLRVVLRKSERRVTVWLRRGKLFLRGSKNPLSLNEVLLVELV